MDVPGRPFFRWLIKHMRPLVIGARINNPHLSLAKREPHSPFPSGQWRALRDSLSGQQCGGAPYFLNPFNSPHRNMNMKLALFLALAVLCLSVPAFGSVLKMLKPHGVEESSKCNSEGSGQRA